MPIITLRLQKKSQIDIIAFGAFYPNFKEYNMMIGSKKSTAIVHGERCDIHIFQRSKTVWIVDGEYRGKSFTGSGSTRSAAETNWKKLAERSED